MSRIRIPTCWTADEALTVAYFLEDIMQAIWDTHGKRMSDELQVSFSRGSLSAFPDPKDDDDLDSEIPF